jgi:hypothetical protein
MRFDWERYGGPAKNAGSIFLLITGGLGVWTAQSETFGKWLQGPLKFLWPTSPTWFAPTLAGALTALLFLAPATLLFLSGIKRSTLVPAQRNVFNLSFNQLYGREKDLAELVRLVADNKLVLLTGESGVGKSALLSIGLLGELKKDSRFFPVYFNDYGKEWNESLARNLFHAIQGALTGEQRKTLASENVDPTIVTIEQLTELLRDIPAKLHMVPVLLFDQFDDYQRRFHDHFVAAEGAWQSAEAIRATNKCWDEIAKRLDAGGVKVLFAARTDASTGLISMQFTTDVASRPLYRLEDSLRLLLDGLTANTDKGNEVVKDPENGWTLLKGLLIDDLEEEGRVLPQEVKTVLLGLRSLKYLTPAAYQRAGRAAGVKATFVERAITSVVANQGIAEPIVIEIVKAMVVAPAGTGVAKTEGQTIEQIRCKITKGELSAMQVKSVLSSLRDEEMVRERFDPASKSSLWQLVHDYLATAVLEMEIRRKKWAVRLEHGAAAWRRAKGSMAGRWRALLSPWDQLAILALRLRGLRGNGFRYGANRAYALASTLRIVPYVVVAGLLGTVALYVDAFFRNDAQSLKIEAAIGVGGDRVDQAEAEALLALAKATHGVQDRVIDRMISTDGGAKQAARRPVPLAVAYAGTDESRRQRLAEKLLDAARRSTACPCLEDIVRLFGLLTPSDAQANAMLSLLLDVSAKGSLPSRQPGLYLVRLPGNLDDPRRKELIRQVRNNLDNLKGDADTEAYLLVLLSRLAPKSDDDAAAIARTLWYRLEASAGKNQDMSADILTKLLAERSQLIQPGWISEAIASLQGAKSEAAYTLASARILAVMPKLEATHMDKVWQSIQVWLTGGGVGRDSAFRILRTADPKKLAPLWQEIWQKALPEITNPRPPSQTVLRWRDILDGTPSKGYSASVKQYFDKALAAEDSSFLTALTSPKWWNLLEVEQRNQLVEEAKLELRSDTTRNFAAVAYILALHLRDGHELDQATQERLLRRVPPLGSPGTAPYLWLTVADGLLPFFGPDRHDVVFRALMGIDLSGVNNDFPNLEKLPQKISAVEAARFFENWVDRYVSTVMVNEAVINTRFSPVAEQLVAQISSGEAAKHLHNLIQAKPPRIPSDSLETGLVTTLVTRLKAEDAQSLYAEVLIRLGSNSDDRNIYVLSAAARHLGPLSPSFRKADLVKAFEASAAQARERKRFAEVRALVESIRLIAEQAAPVEANAFKERLIEEFRAAQTFLDYSATAPSVAALAASTDHRDCSVIRELLLHPWTYAVSVPWRGLLNPDERRVEGSPAWATMADWKGKCPDIGVTAR